MFKNNSLKFGRRNITVPSELLLPKKYGGRYCVSLIPGDGIGKEVTDAVVKIFDAENVAIDWDLIDSSGCNSVGEQVQRAVDSVRRNKIGLKGIWNTPVGQATHGSLNVAFRKHLDIFANIAFFKSFPGVQTRLKDVDFVVVRENTEGEYSELEHESILGVVESLKIITKAKCEKIARFAFDFASRNNRRSVCAVHKANIMKLGDGLFKDVVENVGAKEYPDIEFRSIIVDNASMQAVSKPQQFDVLVTPNLYGFILGNIGAALIGGPGLVPGANFGREYAVFEPGSRHVGLDIEGQNVANPTAMILSSTLMLKHLGLHDYADRISKATYSVIEEGKYTTKDIGGTASTTEFTDAVIEKLVKL